jgi:hypothetical protein
MFGLEQCQWLWMADHGNFQSSQLFHPVPHTTSLSMYLLISIFVLFLWGPLTNICTKYVAMEVTVNHNSSIFPLWDLVEIFKLVLGTLRNKKENTINICNKIDESQNCYFK